MDVRKQRTRASVKRAFFELLAEKDYGKITVQDLLERSGVGRATFYAQFHGKGDVLAAVSSDLCAQALADDPLMGPEEQTLRAFANLWERRSCVKVLVSGAGAQAFADCLRHACVARADRVVPGCPAGPAGQMDRGFLLHHIAAAFVGAIQWWAWHDFAASPEEVSADFIRAIDPLFAPESNMQQACLPESGRRDITCTPAHVHDGPFSPSTGK